ncbi:Putative endonuclease FLJ39025 like protein [Pteropus alecto]|uniref:Putative endonuclease FLJ39025 like protein n=1 Tax=Pteropus alecto TaxID=9402 RepID=L5KKU1_PTEAL|nr:Putative endonuclease FLJ39025 like protein [Pteropus alecto]
MVSLTAPYVPGFLAFREGPFLVDAVRRLQEKEPHLSPQAGFGVACHLGVHTDLPSIGVAKKLLQVDGLENNALHREKIRLLQAGGDTFPLTGGSGAVLGMALRSHDHSTKPLYVSVGHKMSLEAAVRLIRSCCRFRIPEPVRQADIRSRDYIRRTLGGPGPPRTGAGEVSAGLGSRLGVLGHAHLELCLGTRPPLPQCALGQAGDSLFEGTGGSSQPDEGLSEHHLPQELQEPPEPTPCRSAPPAWATYL